MKFDYLYCFEPDASGNHAILNEAIAFILLGLHGMKGELAPLFNYNFAGAENVVRLWAMPVSAGSVSPSAPIFGRLRSCDKQKEPGRRNSPDSLISLWHV